ncbi:hypothetical protein [Microvirga tunisiensis]|uniref:hypothetical protein n=1 Tax=Microvirga tunisiensis TaxID=2108360 RepID=UPI001FCE4316|nr:hypothetical protein [Microvirga tunisiensis]
MERDKAEDRLLVRNTLQHEIAERPYRVSRNERCHLSRAHSALVHAFGNRFQSADEIDCGAHHHEIQAICAADVAVSDKAVVQTADKVSMIRCKERHSGALHFH